MSQITAQHPKQWTSSDRLDRTAGSRTTGQGARNLDRMTGGFPHKQADAQSNEATSKPLQGEAKAAKPHLAQSVTAWTQAQLTIASAPSEEENCSITKAMPEN
jgi:hypothetical protein